MPKRKRAIGYIRSSTKAQEGGRSIQKREILKWAEDHGFEIVAFHVEVCSGARHPSRRRTLQEAINDIEKKNAPYLVVESWDRLTRGGLSHADLIDEQVRNKNKHGKILTVENFRFEDVQATKKLIRELHQIIEDNEEQESLSSLRKRLHITKTETAKAAGVSLSTISRIEEGPIPDVAILRRMIESFGGELKVIAKFGNRSVVLSNIG